MKLENGVILFDFYVWFIEKREVLEFKINWGLILVWFLMK